MSNPNSNPFNGKSENDSESSSDTSEKPAASAPAVEFLMKKSKQEEEQQKRAKEKEDDAPEAPKRKRVGSALRKLLKRRRSELAAVPAAESAADTEQVSASEPAPAEKAAEKPQSDQEKPDEKTPENPEPAKTENELTHGTELKFDHGEPKSEEKSDSIFDQLRSAAETPVASEQSDDSESPADEPPLPPRKIVPGSDMPREPARSEGPSFGNLPPASPDLAPRNTTTIIENDTSAAGHLTTLYAANFLSKRRDKKLKRQDRKLEKNQNEMAEVSAKERKRLREAEKTQHSESSEHHQRLRKVERKLDEQPVNSEKSARIEQPRTEAKPGSVEENPATQIQFEKAAEVVASPAKVSEVLAAREFAREMKPAAEEAAKSESKKVSEQEKEKDKDKEQDLREFYAAEARKHAKETEDEHRELIRIQTSEKEPDDVRESVFERRHEIKDEAGSSASRAIIPAGDSSTRERIVHDEPEFKGKVQEQISKAKETAQQAASQLRTDDDMREAVRNGFLIGVGTVAVGIIAYLLT